MWVACTLCRVAHYLQAGFISQPKGDFLGNSTGFFLEPTEASLEYERNITSFLSRKEAATNEILR